ncbi:MAG: hypothetical protein ACE361_19110 [Aureliella sp.]
MQLHFLNDFVGSTGWLGALACGIAAFWIAARSVAEPIARWSTASLRACAVFLIAATLLEPTLQQEQRTGEPGQVHFLIDRSASMEWSDQQAQQESSSRRAERLFDHIFAPDSGLVVQLADRFDAQIQTIGNDGALLEIASFPVGTIESMRSLEADHQLETRGGLHGPPTESSPLRSALERLLEQLQGAGPTGSCVILMSDGQNTDTAALAGLGVRFLEAQVPVYSIGYGPNSNVVDIGLTNGSVSTQNYVDGLVSGSLKVTETVPKGTVYRIQAISNAEALWEQEFVSNGSRTRSVPFSFPAEDLLKARSVDVQLPEHGSVNAEIRFRIFCDIDQIDDNNELSMMTRIQARRNRMLIVDGRSRWETRYIKNLFTRDPTWEVTTCVAHSPSANIVGIPEKDVDLFEYNLVIFGDTNEAKLSKSFLPDLSRFISKRGGGIIFIDGQRENLRQTSSIHLKQILPVRWESWESGLPSRIVPPSDRSSTAIFSQDRSVDGLPFEQLAEVHYVAGVQSRENAKTVLVAKNAVSTTPALVTQQYGAGRVAYLASDETWRWRRKPFDTPPLAHDAATRNDQYHSAFWNQLVLWTMAKPYSQSNDLIALDTGKVVYSPGEPIQVRCQLRQGSLESESFETSSLAAFALIRSDSGTEQRVPLNPHSSIPGQFETTLDSLPADSYHVRVEVSGYPSSALDLEDSFQVVSGSSSELRDYRCNEFDLRQLSLASGGEYLHESEVAQLVPLLRPQSSMRTSQYHFALWQSFGWFSVAITLLAAEWWMRKRYGLI